MATRFVCFGELLLRLGAPGREALLQTPRLEVHVGGAEANVAVALARFGHEAAQVGVIADNALGEAAAGELRRQGVCTRGLRPAPGRLGLYFLSTGALQRPSAVLYDRAGSAFAEADPAGYDWRALLAGADWLHLSGVSPALGERAARASLDAAEAAVAQGVKVSFDGNFRPSLWAASGGDAPGLLRRLMACADLLFADHRDMAVVLGLETPQATPEARVAAAADAAFAAFPRLRRLATTLRETRSVDEHVLSARLHHRDGGAHGAGPIALAGIVDRIGGGDAFAAGVLHGLATGRDDAEALALGLAAAALKHSLPGDALALPASEVEALAQGGRLDVRR